ncbi:MAG: hypothetical protein ABSG14_03215 [Verrucomicrobiia bacterium]|jgi:hypothetical protein
MSGIGQYEASYEYIPSFARKAYLVVFFRRCGLFFIFSAVLFAVGIVGLRSSDNAPVSFIIFGIVTVLWSSWVGGYRASGRNAARLPDRAMRIALSDEALAVQSSWVTTSLRWAAIRVVFEARGVCVLMRRDSFYYMAFPSSALTPDARDLLARKVREAGGRARLKER